MLGLVLSMALVLMAFNYERSPKTVTWENGIWQDGFADTLLLPVNIQPITKVAIETETAHPDPIIVVKNTDKEKLKVFKETKEPKVLPRIKPPGFKVIKPKGIEPDASIFINRSASFPGGSEAFYKFLDKTIHYPEILRVNGTEGRVITRVVINEFGEVGNIEVLKSTDRNFNGTVIQTIKKSPSWEPAMKKSVPISDTIIIPFRFRINN